MKEKKYAEFDRTKVIEEQIAPHIAEIKKICAFENIPFFISLAKTSTKEDTEYYNDGNIPGSIPMDLKKDYFSKFLLVLQDATVSITKPIDEEMQEYIDKNLGDE